VLSLGLRQAWWEDLNGLNGVLKLKGVVWVVAASPLADVGAPNASSASPAGLDSSVLASISRARLIVLGPGDPDVNVLPVLAAPGVRSTLEAARAPRVWAGSPAGQAALAAWLGNSIATATAAPLTQDLQARLLQQAARHAKTQAS
jgi:2-phospho-L-lactate transferase/gluconeogenesis factor (CofD/UPF0052 family)